MSITKEEKLSITKKFGENEKDSGRTEVQIGLITMLILQLTMSDMNTH